MQEPMAHLIGERQGMFERLASPRKVLTLAAIVLLAGCKVIPKGPVEQPTAPPPTVEPTPDVLPTDTARHRVALLVPMSGPNAAVGQSIANAATMALLDTNAANLRVTTYDTATGAADAAAKAVEDGNGLILGPLLSDNIGVISGQARRANVPVISFSNDQNAAGKDVFIMGSLPSQSVTRVVDFARGKGVTTFGALVPRGEYGNRASAALLEAAKAGGGSVVAMEAFDRSNTSVTSAAARLKAKGGYQAVLIADGGRIAARIAPALKPDDGSNVRLLGTELWSGESVVTSTSALEGAWFAAVSDNRFRQFSNSYKSRFGNQPYRIATLGYDAVLLTLRVARDWKVGSAFPTGRMLDSGGFLGLDGPFRFNRNGIVERALEVRQVRPGGVDIVSPAPTRFDD
jgi:ABC-type branched-subunit amino acid transport system substrate-binding protein